jgi:hypothetical protein
MKRTQLAAAVLLATGSVSALAATYSVTPVPLQDNARNNFARSIDDAGNMLSMVQLEYNPPIDVEQLENDTTFFAQFSGSLDSEDDVKQGVFSDNDYTIIVNFLLSNQNAVQGQKLADFRTYITDTTDAELVPGLDQITEKFGDYTRSVESAGRDSLDGDFIVGDSSALVIVEPYENDNGDVINYTYPESSQQAFVQVNGVTNILPPVDATVGGFASARAINDNLQVAGFSTVSFLDSVGEAADECANEETRGDIPESRCLYGLYLGDFTVPRVDGFFRNNANLPAFVLASEVNATIWQLDVNGSVISTETFPLLFTPEEDDTSHYFTYAYDINNQGIAVGEALTGDPINIARPGSSTIAESERVAVVFRDGETSEMLPRDENLLSEAVSINDNNWVAGTVVRANGEIARPRLLAYNLDTAEQIVQEGFFTSSGVVSNAINNNNIIVGKADIDPSSEAVRLTSAFMFDIATEELVDLNDLIACDSPYTLVEAVDINDNNEIIANARLKTVSKYVTGEDIIDSQGETTLVDSIVAVKLSPIANGSIEECEPDEDDLPNERQGASSSMVAALFMLGALVFRRRNTIRK